jgi:hypothetical protein
LALFLRKHHGRISVGKEEVMEESKKLSVAQCKAILQKSGKILTDEQVLKIRDLLYVLGELDYLILKETLNRGSPN